MVQVQTNLESIDGTHIDVGMDTNVENLLLLIK